MNGNGNSTRRRYEIQVEAVAGAPWRGVPADERLRRLLKSMLRSYGYRCTAVRPVEREVVFRTGNPSNRGPIER